MRDLWLKDFQFNTVDGVEIHQFIETENLKVSDKREINSKTFKVIYNELINDTSQ